MTSLRLLPEFEDDLRRLPGVVAASVVTGPDAQPTEIHILAEPGKPPKQLVRDVQSFAMLRLGADIDHRIVSVVQIDAEDMPARADDDRDGPTVTRPAIASIMIRRSGQETEAVVSIAAAGGLVFEGRVVGPGGAPQRPRLIAQATLAALAEPLGAPAEVEWAQVVPAGERDIALVVLSVTIPRLGEQAVSGTAIVRGDEADAVARAVLDALNRRLAT